MRELTTRVEFEVVDKLVIADPCYIDQNDYDEGGHPLKGGVRMGSGTGIVLERCDGLWTATIELSNEGSWGTRVSKLIATKEEAGRVYETEAVDRNGVDSGQMFIGCWSSVPLDYDALLSRYSTHKYGSKKWHEGYDTSIQMLGFAEGAVSSTGYGDGRYPVLVSTDRDGKPVKVEVHFLPYELDDEGEVDGEDLLERMRNR